MYKIYTFCVFFTLSTHNGPEINMLYAVCVLVFSSVAWNLSLTLSHTLRPREHDEKREKKVNRI